MGVKWVVGNGDKIRFWEDPWLGNTSLAILFGLSMLSMSNMGKPLKTFGMGKSCSSPLGETFLNA